MKNEIRKRITRPATPEETEGRLLRGLHKLCPDLPAQGALVDSIAMLRRGRVLRPGQKVLVVLDQFDDLAAAETNNAIGDIGNGGVVRDDHDRLA